MIPLKVAVLEDNKTFLIELVDNLKRTGLVNVLVYEQTSDAFIQGVRKKQPEALLLDIHLKDENTNGVLVAEILRLPVLFLSAERKNFLDSIDNLKLLGAFPVEEIGKTPDTNKLKTILKTFIPRVREYQKQQKVRVKPKGEDEILINPCEVAFIESIKGTGNHKINFVSRKPIITADKTFKYFRSIGFLEDRFVEYSRSFLFNTSIVEYIEGNLQTSFVNDKGEEENFSIDVPSERRKEIKEQFLK